jgi:hypothetical protein
MFDPYEQLPVAEANIPTVLYVFTPDCHWVRAQQSNAMETPEYFPIGFLNVHVQL